MNHVIVGIFVNGKVNIKWYGIFTSANEASAWACKNFANRFTVVQLHSTWDEDDGKQKSPTKVKNTQAQSRTTNARRRTTGRVFSGISKQDQFQLSDAAYSLAENLEE